MVRNDIILTDQGREKMNTKTTNEILHDHDLRITPQRVWVYEYLCTHHTHPDADEIYEALLQDGHNVTRATVYNVLQALVKRRLINEVKADSTRTRYDALVEPHGHFICYNCNKIYDFDVNLLNFSGLNGFETLQKDIYFSGVCNKCKNILK